MIICHPDWKSLSRYISVIGFLFLCSVIRISAQLFPGLEGDALVVAIRDAYTPSITLTDTQVKDTLYARVFIDNDSIRCIYSGLAHDLPPGVDPSQWIYENGTAVNSMNLEHGWPQSKGAGEGTAGNRNMHHLYPSRSAINSDRGDFPYAEIPDATTQKWYYLGTVSGAKPTSNIDAYSEFKSGAFEPREQVKGDIARAMFYFWTIYREDAIEADPLFFDVMRSNLCAWHEADPVDAFEMLRSERIASYQSDMPNPFVLDCSLAKRTYCPNLNSCDLVALEDLSPIQENLYYDPVAGSIFLQGAPGKIWSVLGFDILGKKIFECKTEALQKVNVGWYGPGILFMVATDGRHQIFGRQLVLVP